MSALEAAAKVTFFNSFTATGDAGAQTVEGGNTIIVKGVLFNNSADLLASIILTNAADTKTYLRVSLVRAAATGPSLFFIPTEWVADGGLRVEVEAGTVASISVTIFHTSAR